MNNAIRRVLRFLLITVGFMTQETWMGGRVFFISFFHGAGYCVWISRKMHLAIPGFTLYVRTTPSKVKTLWSMGNGNTFKHVAIRTNPNFNCFG